MKNGVMSEIKIIEGKIFKDFCGYISSLNKFRFSEIKRFYIIHHPKKEIVRGWNGHKFEKKWFYCVKGAFIIALVKIDNWDYPSSSLVPSIIDLSEDSSKIICVPEGYANCIKATMENSILLVFSDKSIEEARNDSCKYDKNLWVDWNNIENRKKEIL